MKKQIIFFLLIPFISISQFFNKKTYTVSKIEDCDGKDSFFEQLIIRRELSENFCYSLRLNKRDEL